MKEQRSVSVPGIHLEPGDDEKSEDDSKSTLSGSLVQIRPGTLYEVLIALKEKDR